MSEPMEIEVPSTQNVRVCLRRGSREGRGEECAGGPPHALLSCCPLAVHPTADVRPVSTPPPTGASLGFSTWETLVLLV